MRRRVFMCYDTHEVELPDHPGAQRNYNYGDPRIRVEWVPL